jgi:acetate kinase
MGTISFTMTAVLAVNAGSSSLKYALFGSGESSSRLISGKLERIGEPGGPANHAACMEPLLAQVTKAGGVIDAIGHRIVHGGPRYLESTRVSRELLAELRRLSSWDPEHLPSEIALIEALAQRFPDTPQVACFDTAFHRDLPPVSRILPIPRKYEAAGVRRYGFHGLSYSYLVEQLRREPEGLPQRLVLAHLGNGASVAAVRDGRSIDTTMGFTPTAGLPMSRRAGDIDPGLVAYLARTEGMTAEGFDEMVNTKSGLLGISETSSDVRDLLQREKDDVRSAEALAIFCYRVKQTIGGFAAALGGLDTVVFSGGIGEQAAEIRARILEGLEFLGIVLDPARNAAHAAVITRDDSRVRGRVMRTDEESEIARATREVLKA